MWVQKWRDWIWDKPKRPGVWRRRDGGYHVRGRVRDPRTGMLREINYQLPDSDLDGAVAFLADQKSAIRSANQPTQRSKTRFASFAAQLLQRKVEAREILSAKGREKWADILEHHLIPEFGAMFMDEIRRSDIEAWRNRLAARIGRSRGKISPHTANGWIAVLRVIFKAATVELELDRNPVGGDASQGGVKPFDTATWPTYTDESPNSLRPEDVSRFLEEVFRSWPQHYAMIALGFATGLRPSSLRPLRRKGSTPDVLWDAGVLLVRRSHTRGEEIMETTKTKVHQRIALPDDLMEVLRWHAEAQLVTEAEKAGELLFPTSEGGLRSPSCLDKPFKAVGKALRLGYPVTPRSMRRTFQDLARAAEIRDVVTRSVSGHATEAMQRHYSTVNPDEQRHALAKVAKIVNLDAVRKARASNLAGSGVESGVEAGQEKAPSEASAPNGADSFSISGAGEGT